MFDRGFVTRVRARCAVEVVLTVCITVAAGYFAKWPILFFYGLVFLLELTTKDASEDGSK